MRTVMFAAMTVAYGICLVIKGRDLRRDPGNPFLRWLCTMVGFSGLASLAGIPAILTALETSTGVAAVWVLAPVTVGSAATVVTLQLWARPRARLRLSLIPYAAAAAAIVALTVSARGATTPAAVAAAQQMPETLWATVPGVRAAFLIYCGAIGFAYVDAAIRLTRTARVLDRRWLRRAMRTLATAATLLLVYTVAMAGYFLSPRPALADLGLAELGLAELGLAAAGLGAVTCATGVGLPVLGPRWDRMRAYRRLRHLWQALGRAVPDVVLDPPRLPWLDAWNPWRADFRLYRRVIEIRDGVLALRPHLDPAVADAARRLAREAGQAPDEQAATAAAAQLRAALTRLEGSAPAVHGEPPPIDLTPAGPGLDAELRVLVPLARAFASSPIVRHAAAPG
ncbi:MAB_1171c family putative transporter [Paractinoplanes rishiriensis]|uniref:DUF6545 domain-containing protein n=1 Tax=Paractinoplanes rishiriensis TaxID=1050105 RepID=A0A919JV06_9ACTN|nr:MAB_1171c family putative transporter [Actinoplanes rishiriensis]GIE94135.1 hypothetical protein Ari01nite_16000 [Actinoplanes rishiriensis]